MEINTDFFKKGIFIAPLAGYSDAAFRQICLECGAKLSITEMISARAVVENNKKTLSLLTKSKVESPFCVQLFGGDVEYIIKAINHEALKNVDIIDINMGCSIPKIMKSYAGAFLLNNIEKTINYIKEIINCTNKVITIKIRLNKDFEQTLKFIDLLNGLDIKAIYVHGRTPEQKYSGKSDWEKINILQQKSTIPVIGNGDLKEYYQITEKMIENAVMIGRGIIGNFSLLEEIFNKNLHTKKYFMLRQLNLMNKYYGENYTIKNFKKHFAYYCIGKKYNNLLKKEFYSINTYENQLLYVKNNINF